MDLLGRLNEVIYVKVFIMVPIIVNGSCYYCCCYYNYY